MLILFGVLVIGMVDNILRPVLVGKDTKMPDYAVLISTLGGMALFGLNGFVIGPLIAALFMACWDLFAPAPEEPAARPAERRPSRNSVFEPGPAGLVPSSPRNRAGHGRDGRQHR